MRCLVFFLFFLLRPELDRTDAVRTPIIAMTANAYREDIELALESGMNGHIAKPIDIKVVIRTLMEYIKS